LCGQNKADSACSQDSAVEIAHSQSDFPGQVAALGSLGNAHRLQGEYDEAIQYLEKSLEIAKQIDNKIYISSALNGLANTYTSLANQITVMPNLLTKQVMRELPKI
jgi:tetratricopeptide (TPR) repeat protein